MSKFSGSICIGDDDFDIAESLKLILENEGYTVSIPHVVSRE